MPDLYVVLRAGLAIVFLVGLRAVPSDGYGRTFDGQVTGTGHRLPSVKFR